METTELMPEYILQPHAISRSVYRLSATARKIIAMAMAILPPDLSTRTACFKSYDFCQALGIEWGGNTYHLIKEAVRECFKSDITLETPTGWKMFTWFSQAEYHEANHEIRMEFSEELADLLMELKKMYAKIQLEDLGKLQSQYALRLYEFAISYSSLAGQRGNRTETWYFERKVEELRNLFGIEANHYKLTADFRKWVIERPLNEINTANIGIAITPEYKRKGKYITDIKFECTSHTRKVAGRRSKKTAVTTTPDAPPTNPKLAKTLEVKENEHLKKLYPEEYAQLYQEELAKPHIQFSSTDTLWSLAAEGQAIKRLREHYGVRK
jgi:plasmid replication initiation protein